MITIQSCKADDFFTEKYKYYADLISEKRVFHRKQWEIISIVNILKSKNFIQHNKKGLTTDKVSTAISSYLNSNNVEFSTIDSINDNEIDQQFDFFWSSESYKTTKEVYSFIEQVPILLRNMKSEGIIVISVDFIIDSTSESVKQKSFIYKNDINNIITELQECVGYSHSLILDKGEHEYNDIVDEYPYKGSTHIKLRLNDDIITSLLIIIEPKTDSELFSSKELNKQDLPVDINIHNYKSNKTDSIYWDNGLVLSRLYNGRKIFLTTTDTTSLCPHIAIDGYFDLPTTYVIENLVKENSIFIDIGCNVGYFSLVVRNKTKKIIALDASSVLVKNLKKTFSLNGISPDNVYNYAVSNIDNEVLRIHILEDFIGSSTILLDKIPHKEKYVVSYTEDIKSITLDSLIINEKINASDISLVKIDIEGYEDKALFGFLETIKNNKDIKILIEFNLSKYNDPDLLIDMIYNNFIYVYKINDISNYSDQANKIDESKRAVEYIYKYNIKNPVYEGANLVLSNEKLYL